MGIMDQTVGEYPREWCITVNLPFINVRGDVHIAVTVLSMPDILTRLMVNVANIVVLKAPHGPLCTELSTTVMKSVAHVGNREDGKWCVPNCSLCNCPP